MGHTFLPPPSRISSHHSEVDVHQIICCVGQAPCRGASAGCQRSLRVYEELGFPGAFCSAD
eukprot:3181825-Prymnesium_polylepis.1